MWGGIDRQLHGIDGGRSAIDRCVEKNLANAARWVERSDTHRVSMIEMAISLTIAATSLPGTASSSSSIRRHGDGFCKRACAQGVHRMLRSTSPLRRGALLIRSPRARARGPGSAVQHDRTMRSLSSGGAKRRPVGSVPSMIDSLEVKVLYPA
jgi:hypothetical protein